MISRYWSGDVTTPTRAWFLAAARIIAGPPMSICSTSSSSPTPRRCTHSSKG